MYVQRTFVRRQAGVRGGAECELRSCSCATAELRPISEAAALRAREGRSLRTVAGRQRGRGGAQGWPCCARKRLLGARTGGANRQAGCLLRAWPPRRAASLPEPGTPCVDGWIQSEIARARVNAVREYHRHAAG